MRLVASDDKMGPVSYKANGRSWDELMRTELSKMLAGELYDALDPELVHARERASDLCRELNATGGQEREARRRILTELFGNGGESVRHM